MALLEAWQMERPVLVNGQCDVLRVPLPAIQWRFVVRQQKEWVAVLNCVDRPAQAPARMAGQAYVRARYTWDPRWNEAHLDLLP